MFENLVHRFSVICTIVLFFSCGGKNQQPLPQAAPPPVPVTVAEVSSTAATYYDEYPGTVVALNEIRLTAQVSGYITGVFFQDGAKVSKGQRLYSIDAQVYSANYEQSVANLAVQETNMMKAKKDAERYHELDKEDAVAKQQVDYADAAYTAAQKQVAAARANVSAVRSNVNFASIYAPFSGTIGISQVKKGTAVVAGNTILNIVSTDNPMAVDFSVDQKDIYRFILMQKSGAAKGDSTFTIAFGNDAYPAIGKISLIDRAVNPQTGTIKIRLEFPNKEGMLKAGMNTTVRILNIASAKSVLIPYKAVAEQLGEFFVYVLGDSSKVSQRKIQLSKQVGLNVIVKEGLKEGEKIVVEGVQNLREGTAVNPARPADPAASPKN